VAGRVARAKRVGFEWYSEWYCGGFRVVMNATKHSAPIAKVMRLKM